MSAAIASLLNEELLNAYTIHLHAVATENQHPPDQHPDRPHIDAPATFLRDFLHGIATADPPLQITRHGMDAALDILFAHPALRPLLLDDHSSVALQQHIADTLLPDATPLFAAHWAHIIRPAWDQHRELQRVVAASAQA